MYANNVVLYLYQATMYDKISDADYHDDGEDDECDKTDDKDEGDRDDKTDDDNDDFSIQ